MRGILTGLTCCLLLIALPLQAALISRVAAVVNDDIITTFELNQRMHSELGSDSEDLHDIQVRETILEEMVRERLMDQRIEKLGILVSPEDVDMAIQDVERQNNITREQLTQALEAQGLSMETYRQQLHRQLLEFRLVSREIRDQVEVSNHEMRQYFQENFESYREDPYLRLSRLSFAVPAGASASQRSALRALSREALDRLRGGEPFERVLEHYRQERGAEGGSLGRFGQGDLSEPFASAVATLQIGQYSEVVDTAQGLHILRLDERNPGRVPEFEEVREQISRLLIEQKREAALDNWLTNLRQQAHIEIRI